MTHTLIGHMPVGSRMTNIETQKTFSPNRKTRQRQDTRNVDLISQTSMQYEPASPNMSYAKLKNTVSHKFTEFEGLSEPSSPMLLKNESNPPLNKELSKSFKLDRILPMHAGAQEILDTSVPVTRESPDESEDKE